MIDSKQIRASLERMPSAYRRHNDLARWVNHAAKFEEVPFSLYERIHSLYLAPAFLDLKIREPGGVAGLIDEFDLLTEEGPQGEKFRPIRNALRLSANILAGDPDQLPTQLLARLPASGDGYIGHLRCNLRNEYSQVFNPVRTALIGAELAFTATRISGAKLTALEFAPDCSLAAILDANGRIFLAELSNKSFKLQGTIPCRNAQALAFTPSGSHLLVGTGSGLLFVIDPKSRTKVDERRFRRGIYKLLCLDEDRIVFDHEDGTSIARWVDGEELALIGAAEGVDFSTALEVIPSRGIVVTGESEGRIDAWNDSNGHFSGRIGWFGQYQEGWMPKILVQGQMAIIHGAWATDGTISEPIDYFGLLEQVPGLSPETRESVRRELKSNPQRHWVTSVLASDDGSLVVAGTIRGLLCAWDTKTGTRLGWLEGHRGTITSLTLAPDGDRLISTGDGTVRMWSLSSMTPLGQFPTTAGKPTAVRCADAYDLVVAACDDGTLVAWNLSGRLMAPDSGLESEKAVEVSCPRGETRGWLITESGSIDELSLDSGARFRRTKPPIGPSIRVQISQEGRRLGVVTEAGVYVVDVTTGLILYERLWTEGAKSEGVFRLAVSNDGERVVLWYAKDNAHALLGQRGQLDVLDMRSGERRVLDLAMGYVDRIAVSPSGQFALVESQFKVPNRPWLTKVDLWNLDKGERIKDPAFAHSKKAGAFAFRTDGDTLLWSEGQVVRQLRLSAPNEAVDLLVTSRAWRSITITPDDSFAAVLVDQTRLELWDLRQLSCLARFDADKMLTSCAAAPNMNAVLAIDSEGGVYVFHFPFGFTPDREQQPLPHDHRSSDQEILAKILDSIVVRNSSYVPIRYEALKDLAKSPQFPSIFRISLARFLHSSEHSNSAKEVIYQIIEEREPVSLRHALAALHEFGAYDGIVKILEYDVELKDGAELIEVMCNAADLLARNQNQNELSVIADRATAAVGRLIAAQALADLDESAAADTLKQLAYDNSIDLPLRALAWMSLRAVLPSKEWLERVTERVARENWPIDLRRRISRDVLYEALSGDTIMALLPVGPPDNALPIVPLLRAEEWHGLALALNIRGQYDAAIAAMDRAISRRPKRARYYFSHGGLCLRAGIKFRDRRNVPGHNDPGQPYFERAVESLSKAIDLDLTFEKAWGQRGYAYFELEEYELALEDLEQAIVRGDKHWITYTNLASCLHQLGRHAAAETSEAEAERLRKNDPHQSIVGMPPIEGGQLRAGDEPGQSEQELAEIQASARQALKSLGIIAEIRTEVVAAIRKATIPDYLSDTAMELLTLLDAQAEIEALAVDGDVPDAYCVAAAGHLLRREGNDWALGFLRRIATDSSRSTGIRISAAEFIAKSAPITDSIHFIREVTDVQYAGGSTPFEVWMVIQMLNTLRHHPQTFELLVDLARDLSAPAMVRLTAAELVSTIFDDDLGRTLLVALRADLPSDSPLAEEIAGALEFLQDLSHDEIIGIPIGVQEAFEAFIMASSPEDIEPLAEEYQSFFDPDFVDFVESKLNRIPPEERERFSAKVARLRAIPPDPQMCAFLSFLKAGSLEEMREAVALFPALSDPDFLPILRKYHQASTGKSTSLAFERRIGWIKVIGPDPWQLALRAFALAETEADLRIAAQKHPLLTQRRFAKVAKKVLGDQADWEIHSQRLELLKTLELPHDRDAMLAAASSAINLNRPEEALKLIDSLDWDEDPPFLWLRASALRLLCRYEEGIEVLNSLIAIHPRASAYVYRAQAYFNLGYYSEAIPDCNEAIQLDPNYVEAWFGRGLAYARLLQFGTAIDDLTQAIALSPNKASLFTTRAGFYVAQGRNDEGTQDLRTAIEISPGEAEPRIMLAQLFLSLDSPNEARSVLSDSRLQPSDAELSEISDLLEYISLSKTLPPYTVLKGLITIVLEAKSPLELANIANDEPLLRDLVCIGALERYSVQFEPEALLSLITERLDSLRELLTNPMQYAFNALMNVESIADLETARLQHPLLCDPDFLITLAGVEDQMKSDSDKAHLRSLITQLRALL